MKASNVVAPAKVAKAAPDLEEAFEEEDEAEIIAEPREDEDDELDLKKDKYIKQPKAKKPAAKKKATAKKKAAKNEDKEDEEDESEEDLKPKKGKAKPKAKPKARSKN